MASLTSTVNNNVGSPPVLAAGSTVSAVLHEHAGEFSNYDVLLAKNHLGTSVLDPNQNHIGNNRFQILTNMHREEFDERLTAGENTLVVVKKIIDIVCRQCVPQGRFLLTEGRGRWMVLTEEEIEAFVMDFLVSPLTTGMPRLTPPEALTNSLPMRKVQPTAAQNPSTAQGQQQQQQQQPPQHLRATISDVDSEKKRRRRSSLLRRSISDGSFEDKKKLGRSLVKIPNLFHAAKPQWLAKFTGKESVQPLDVLFNRDKAKLAEGHTGNNRLAVMISMQQNTYLTSGVEEREKMVKEVYFAVTEAWKGRFLSESPDKRGYVVLDRPEALDGVTCLFDPESGSTSETIPTPTIAIEESLDESASSSYDSKRPSVVKHETIQALHKLKPPVENDANGLRNAALAQLQKRRQKQSLNSRIRDLTANFRTGSSVPITSPAGRSISAPAENFPGLDDDFPLNFTPVPLPMIPVPNGPAPPLSSLTRDEYQLAESLPSSMGTSSSLPQPHLQSSQTLPTTQGGMPRSSFPLPMPQRRENRSQQSFLLRQSMLSDMDAGLIEQLLSGLDVSGDLGAPSPGSPPQSSQQGSG